MLDGVAGQVGEVAERAEPEPLQQPDELAAAGPVVLQHVHGQPAQERRRAPSGTTTHDWTSAVRPPARR